MAKLSIEIPRDSEEYCDYECTQCGRKIRFTPEFFMAGFKFPLTLKCAGCTKEFEMDLKIHETDVTKLGKYNKRSGRTTPGKVGGDTGSNQ